MNFRAIQSNRQMLGRVRLVGRIKELTLEIKEANDELRELKEAPWYDFRAMVRRMKLRRFMLEMSAQIREYRAELQGKYEQQNQQNKWKD